MDVALMITVDDINHRYRPLAERNIGAEGFAEERTSRRVVIPLYRPQRISPIRLPQDQHLRLGPCLSPSLAAAVTRPWLWNEIIDVKGDAG